MVQNEPNEKSLKKSDSENEDELTVDLIKIIIEKSPKLGSISLVLPKNAEVMNAIPSCVENLGIGALKLLTSLEFKATFADTDYWQVVSGMGLKLKYLRMWLSINAGYQQGCLKTFLESQAETLTTLVIGTDFTQSDITQNSRTGRVISVEFPCMSKLNNLTITGGCGANIRFSNICYKSQLPELTELRIHQTPFERCTEFLNKQTTGECFEKLEKLTLSEMRPTPAAVRRIAKFFPNIRKLGICSEQTSVEAVYQSMPQLEELCLMIKDEDQCLDDVIRGLDETGNLLRYLEDPPSNSWNRAIEKLESGLEVTMASLENLKILRIHRDTDDWTRHPDFKEISGYVLKKMKNLEFIDFGVRKFGPHLNIRLQQDLKRHFALVWKLPPHRRSTVELLDDESDSEDNEVGSVSPQVSSDSDHSLSDSD